MSKIRMSEAILAGAAAMKAEAGKQYEEKPDGTVTGCALGMANVAAGGKYEKTDKLPAGDENLRSAGTSMIWGKWVKRKVIRPCSCRYKSEREMVAEAWKNRQNPDPWFAPCTADGKVFVFRLLEKEMAIEDIIPHIFDTHVMGDFSAMDHERMPERWTIEQLADWVEGVEPTEEEKFEQEWGASFRRMDKLFGAMTGGDLMDALKLDALMPRLELMPRLDPQMPWPSNFGRPYHYLGIDWGRGAVGGAIQPGETIDLEAAVPKRGQDPVRAVFESEVTKLMTGLLGILEEANQAAETNEKAAAEERQEEEADSKKG